jgi:hypothetical protein
VETDSEPTADYGGCEKRQGQQGDMQGQPPVHIDARELQ